MCARNGLLVNPICRQNRKIHRIGCDAVLGFYLQQLVRSGEMIEIELEMNQNFEHRRRRAFGQINDSTALGVPARRSDDSADSLEIRMVADSPKDH